MKSFYHLSLFVILAMIGVPARAQHRDEQTPTNLLAQTTNWQQLVKLPSPGSKMKRFGQSVSIDGTTTVIGIPQWGSGKGVVLVVDKNSHGTTIAQLRPSDGFDNDDFGLSVGISGNTVVVGPEVGRKKAYVFVKPDGGWANMHETAQLTPSDAGDTFGFAVGIKDDVIAVGAYVFVQPPTGWANTTETARLQESQPEPDSLGSSVSVDSGSIVVGAPGRSPHGAAFVYIEPPAGWSEMTETAELTISSLTEFGKSVSISGSTIAIGAPTDTGTGTAFVFVEPEGGWITGQPYSAKLTASDAGGHDTFGTSIATTGNLVIVGSPGSQNGSKLAEGAIYSFVEPNNGWSGSLHQSAKATASDSPANLYFGFSLSFSGQLLVVGAPGDPASLQNGEVYAFRYLTP